MVEVAMDQSGKKADVNFSCWTNEVENENSTKRKSQRDLFDYLTVLLPPPVFLHAAARALLEVPLALQATVALPPGRDSAQRLSNFRLYRSVASRKLSVRPRRRFERTAGCRWRKWMLVLMNESDEEGARRRRICGNFQ